jgi:SHS2 domain-containing protein
MSRSAAPARSKAGWEHFPHDADVGVRGPGAMAAEAFEQAAHVLTAVITHAEVEPQRSVEVRRGAGYRAFHRSAAACIEN